MPVRKRPGSARIYQMKVTIKGVRPPIWRRIQVAANTDLNRFHWILATVMGWSGGHLHEFLIDGECYGLPLPEMDDDMGYEVIDESKVKLSDVAPVEKTTFTYVYDMGDDWNHEILVEKILSIEAGVRYPVCLTGKRSCPPEDCGGPMGYEDLLEAIQDPSHPEHDELVEWLDEDFDPERFDLEFVNRGLRGTR